MMPSCKKKVRLQRLHAIRRHKESGTLKRCTAPITTVIIIRYLTFQNSFQAFDSNTGVVWVNEATGRVEARGIGSAIVYATAQDGTGVKGSCTVQVEAPIPVCGINICHDNYVLKVGEITYFSYDIYPSDATNKSVTWCSSNPTIAEVNISTGKVTAKSVGSALITATTNDGCFTATAFVCVERTRIYQTENTFERKGDGLDQLV